MSGIAGIYQLDGRPANSALLKQMASALAHRRPDAVRHWHDGPVALAHCMLYTTPESLHELQPLRDETGQLVITFDGRVDNRDELRELLLSNGFPVHTDTDAKLVLEAYRCWGEGCAATILGDFAFAIYDGRKRLLFCARDPIGVKPFYYHFDGKKFLFSSEIQPLLRDMTMGLEPNVPLIRRYMKGDYSDRTATLYRGIYRIPPAHHVVIDSSGSMQSKCYWDVNPGATIHYETPGEYVAHFLQLFREAVRCRLRVIGPVGTLLSGGLDSSSIVCTAQRLMAEGLASDIRFETFSAVSNALPLSADGESFDERSYIESVLRMYDLQSNYYFYEDQTPPVSIIETARIYRDVSYNPTLSVLSAILAGANEKGIRVLLSGIGGDDILGSDPELYLYRYADLMKQFKITELLQDLGLALKYYSPLEVSGLFLKYGVNPFVVSLAKTLIRLLSLPSRNGYAIMEPQFSSMFQERIYHNLLQGWNTNLGLEDLDKCCSYNMIEPRHPFLDIRLVKFILGLPPEQLSRKFQTKLILRRAMKGILPEIIRLRRTKGSGFPLVDTELRGVRKEEIQQLLESPTLLEGIDWPYIRRSFAKYCENELPIVENIHVHRVERAISLELWHRTAIQSKGG